jgi:hypothetical protein
VLVAAGVAFSAETPCNEARAAPRDRMVGSFFAMPHLPKVRIQRKFCSLRYNQIVNLSRTISRDGQGLRDATDLADLIDTKARPLHCCLDIARSF